MNNSTSFLTAFDQQASDLGCDNDAGASAALPQTGSTSQVHPYFIKDGCIYENATAITKPPLQLTNFTATITAEVSYNNGVEQSLHLEVESVCNSRKSAFTLPAEDFEAMKWVIPEIGAKAVVIPGYGNRGKVRAAIQHLSKNIEERRIMQHTGWIKHDQQWAWLHSGGAIGPEGNIVGVKVALDPPLDCVRLPDAPQGAELAKAIRCSLSILELVPAGISYPIMAAVFRSVLGDADFSLHLVGASGSGKSELAALAQQHFGLDFTSRNLPGSWTSTANSLELLAFTAKDALIVIDDFAPSGTRNDVQRLQSGADRLFRNQGNSAGRMRATQDGDLRPVKPPRGLILSTGEDMPRTYSIRARILTLELGKDDMDWAKLTVMQMKAAEGVLARAMSGYLQWLAGRYSELKQGKQARLAELRARAVSADSHKRTPEIVANLMWGFNLYMDYARDSNAITDAEHGGYVANGWETLLTAADAQNTQQESAEPAQMFLEMLRSAIFSERAHLVSMTGRMPFDGKGFGWSRNTGSSEMRALGKKVGWVDGEDLYLESTAAYAMADAVAVSAGSTLGIQPGTLNKRLKEGGFLVSTGEERGRIKVQRTVEGARQEVLHLKLSSVIDLENPASAAVQQHRWPPNNPMGLTQGYTVSDVRTSP